MIAPLRWDELRATVHAFVARRARPADVDDIVQDAMIRIHRSASSVRDPARFPAWARSVARSAIIDHHRRAPREVPADESLPEAADIATGHDTADTTDRDRLARCMVPFVHMLPPVYREAIELVELAGVPQARAAAQLGVPVSTMKARVQRGRTKLRELVEMCCRVALGPRGDVLDVTPRRDRCTTC